MTWTADLRRPAHRLDRRAGGCALESERHLCGHRRVRHSLGSQLRRRRLQVHRRRQDLEEYRPARLRARSAASSSIRTIPTWFTSARSATPTGRTTSAASSSPPTAATTWTHVLDKGPSVGVSDLAIAAANPNILFAGTWSAASSAVEHLCAAARPRRRHLSLHRQRRELDAADRQRPSRWRLGPRRRRRRTRWQARVCADRGRQEVRALSLRRWRQHAGRWPTAMPRLTSRAWYFMGITVDPNNPDVIYMPNIALYRSEDGGKTISIVRGAPGGDDYHQLWVDPKNSVAPDPRHRPGHNHQPESRPDLVVLVQPADGAVLSRQPPTTNFLTTSTARSRTPAASPCPAAPITARSPAATGSWWAAARADGWRPILATPNILYASGVYGSVVRWDRRTSLSQDITPWPMPNFGSEINQRKYRDPWTPVLVLSPAREERAVLRHAIRHEDHRRRPALEADQPRPDRARRAECRADKAGRPDDE